MFKLPLDESLYIWQSDDHLKLSSDARTLSDFAPIHNNRVVCDMGCGVGNISMLIHRKKNVKILAFDVQEEAVDIFSRTVREQNLSDITPFVADIRDCPIPHDSVDYCVCNPPYTDSWIPKEKDSLGVAMHVGVSFHDIAKCAYNMLKDGGSFCTVLRVDKMPEMLEALRENRFGIIRMQNVFYNLGREASLTLIDARKNRSSQLRFLPPYILEGDTL